MYEVRHIDAVCQAFDKTLRTARIKKKSVATETFLGSLPKYCGSTYEPAESDLTFPAAFKHLSFTVPEQCHDATITYLERRFATFEHQCFFRSPEGEDHDLLRVHEQTYGAGWKGRAAFAWLPIHASSRHLPIPKEEVTQRALEAIAEFSADHDAGRDIRIKMQTKDIVRPPCGHWLLPSILPSLNAIYEARLALMEKLAWPAFHWELVLALSRYPVPGAEPGKNPILDRLIALRVKLETQYPVLAENPMREFRVSADR